MSSQTAAVFKSGENNIVHLSKATSLALQTYDEIEIARFTNEVS
jgi:hypothetical protein